MNDGFSRLVFPAVFLLLLVAMCQQPAKSQQQSVSPPCLPFGLAGEATTYAPFVKRTDRGWHMWIYCRDPYLGVRGYGMTCPHGECIAFDRAVEIARTAVNGGEAGMRSMLASVVRQDRNCARSDLPAPWPALCGELKSLIIASAPNEPAPVWIVAPNASYATRPAYPFAEGVRGTTANGRATVGSVCNCSVRSVEGSRVYCAVNGRTDQVSLCRRWS